MGDLFINKLLIKNDAGKADSEKNEEMRKLVRSVCNVNKVSDWVGWARLLMTWLE